MVCDLAQVNVSRLLAPLGSPRLADFMAALDEVNASGDRAPGFLWRLQAADGNATSVRAFGWDVAGSHGVIVNLTTWTSVQALADFVSSGRGSARPEDQLEDLSTPLAVRTRVR